MSDRREPVDPTAVHADGAAAVRVLYAGARVGDLRAVADLCPGFEVMLDDLEEHFEGLTVSADEFIDAGEKVIVSLRFSGVGRESGAELSGDSYHVHTLESGRPASVEMFSDRHAARVAAGLDGD